VKYYCTELTGLIYLPHEPLEHDGFLLVPASVEASVYEMNDLKCVLVRNSSDEAIIKYFVFCYQFVFPGTHAYFQYSRQDRSQTFELDCIDNNEVIAQINSKYIGSKKPANLCHDFNKLERFYTRLPCIIDFRPFYDNFINCYTSDSQFKDVIDLLLFTMGSHNPLYDNIFQKITQIQTIFETLTGKPPESQCKTCGKTYYTQEWKSYLAKELGKIGILSESDIDLIIKIKSVLNKSSRVKFVHASSQYSVWQETVKSFREGKFSEDDENRDIGSILSIPSDEWAPLNWQNIFGFYQNIVRLLIAKKYELIE